MRGRELVMRLIRAALEPVDPWQLVRKALHLEADNLLIAGDEYDLSSVDRILVLGAGKAAGPMALAIESVLGERVSSGAVVVKDGYGVDGLKRIALREAAHPIPDARSAGAARELLEMATGAGERDLVICLLSGGGSALMALTPPGLTLDGLQRTSEALFRSGAAIDEVNTVRKHLTMASAGRLAAAAFPAAVSTLIISDVIGDSLDIIASGPTTPDPSTFSMALDVIDRYRLRGKLAPAALHRLEEGAAGRIEETPKPGDSVFARIQNHILASNSTAVDAAVAAASAIGFNGRVHRRVRPVTGEAREAARELVAAAVKEWEASARPGAAAPASSLCLIAGGETTVTVTGKGTGGRAQEFALAAALSIEGRRDTLVFAFGTDGTDGPTDAAGAIADGATVARARALGLEPEDYLREHDAYPFFQALGDLIMTGPTGTNVNDIYGVIIG
ncbi:MAG: DUF4147 domain-containing protein [Actinobacteria bacterium]|nr:DUF4147 domain-containing protein [Actinomycetota bacterium]MCL5882942.1 DUF4147 domain-containing protein [Actinomycetota bacterium]